MDPGDLHWKAAVLAQIPGIKISVPEAAVPLGIRQSLYQLTVVALVFFGGRGRGRLDDFRFMAASMAIISCSHIFFMVQHSTRVS